MNEAALAYQYTSMHVVTQSQAGIIFGRGGGPEEATARTTTRSSHNPEIKKMEQELLLYINEGYKESLRLTCWDYGGQAEFLTSALCWCVYLVHVPGH